MEKGISGIVATVLMLIITISLAGTAWMFISGIFITRISTAISVVDSYENVITVRNDGTEAIKSLTLFIDGKKS